MFFIDFSKYFQGKLSNGGHTVNVILLFVIGCKKDNLYAQSAKLALGIFFAPYLISPNNGFLMPRHLHSYLMTSSR